MKSEKMVQNSVDVQIRQVLGERSVYWLAREAKVNESALRRLIAGKTTGIDFKVLARLCTALECKPNDLLKVAR